MSDLPPGADRLALITELDAHRVSIANHMRAARALCLRAGRERDAQLLDQWDDEIADCLDFVVEKLGEGR